MGVFSYLSFKKPVALIWRTFSPARDTEEPEASDKAENQEVPDQVLSPENIGRKISDGSTSSGVSDMSGGSSDNSSQSFNRNYFSPASLNQPLGSTSPRSLGFGSVGGENTDKVIQQPGREGRLVLLMVLVENVVV